MRKYEEYFNDMCVTSSKTKTDNLVIPDASTCIGKAIPLQAWTGPDGSRRLRLPDFKAIGT